ncbi:unnamed protein product [Didymodactylos carnosus]|nr:unnamed protein product [Didymodactylos carnosus]CAF3756423.1 unnamed protein product [Didymodactylos carnosus]
MTTVTFSNDDAKQNICSKSQTSITNIINLFKTIIKNSHTNDVMTTTLKQFVASEANLSSTDEHVNKIEQTCQQLLFQADLIQLDTNELIKINDILKNMNL